MRERDVSLNQGENKWYWDGLGFQGEPLPRGQYDLHIRFGGEEKVLAFSMNKPKQALMYALPSSDTLYLQEKTDWSLQYELTVPGRMQMEISAANAPGEILGTISFDSKKNGPQRVLWNGKLSSGKKLAPGRYVIGCRAKNAPQFLHTFPLTIVDGKRPVQQVEATGPIMPSRHATDAELW